MPSEEKIERFVELLLERKPSYGSGYAAIRAKDFLMKMEILREIENEESESTETTDHQPCDSMENFIKWLSEGDEEDDTEEAQGSERVDDTHSATKAIDAAIFSSVADMADKEGQKDTLFQAFYDLGKITGLGIARRDILDALSPGPV